MTPRNPSQGGFPQLLLDVHDELIVDLFAGGGGASLGIEMATGRQVDVAVNHDPVAVAMHATNHPQTRHVTSDVFEVDPREVAAGRPVGLLWASPDCTDHSRAKGGKPIRTVRRRALAWVVKRWAGTVRPRVILLENVPEFEGWGPLVGPSGEWRRCPRRAGRTFRRWVRDLEGLGYAVEWRVLKAADYGAPTIRQRLFIAARCDGRPIVWPEPSHGPGAGRPYRSAAECIDWTIPMLSIFATREEARAWGRAHGRHAPVRPLAPATLRRTARGVVKFVLDDPEPFLVTLNHSGGRQHAPRGLGEPVRTLSGSRDAHALVATGGGRNILVAPILAGVGGRAGQSPERSGEAPMGTTTAKGDVALIAPYLIPRYGERDGQEPRVRSVEEPHPVVVPTANGAQLVAGLLKHYGGVVGSDLREPLGAVTAVDHHSLLATHIQRDFGMSVGHAADAPLGTVMGDGGHAALIASFLTAYYGTWQGQGPGEPLATVTGTDRHSLVTVLLQGIPYVLWDILMRMLQPRELYRAQGFPDHYRIERAGSVILTKAQQVRLVGNSVPPDVAAALVAANCPELIARDEVLPRVGRAG